GRLILLLENARMPDGHEHVTRLFVEGEIEVAEETGVRFDERAVQLADRSAAGVTHGRACEIGHRTERADMIVDEFVRHVPRAACSGSVATASASPTRPRAVGM